MYKYSLMIITAVFLYCCAEHMPTQQDGGLVYRVIISDQSGLLPTDPDLGYAPVGDAEIILISKSYFETTIKPRSFIARSNQAGLVEFNNLAASGYTMQVEKEIPYQDTTVFLRGSREAEVYTTWDTPDTVRTNIAVPSNVVINEIYYCGPVNRAFYFFDQFVELYNTSNDTVYLDGMLVSRARQYAHPDIETNDFLQGIYLYKFPGEPLTGRDHPLPPGEFTVLASDAYDHSAFIDNAVDLSDAEWEFYNIYGGDLDNPAKNLVNLLPDKSSDFLINLVHNAVILSDGSEWYFGEMNDAGTYQYIHFPISTVLDAVEYCTNAEKKKEITTRVDAGFAGIGVLKYSGVSVERRFPGFDTNNSTLDFINIDTPTPGYQH
jgi:hypothetical protein